MKFGKNQKLKLTERSCTELPSHFVVENFSSSSRCYKTFSGGNLDFQKIKKLKKFVLMSEPALKFEKNCAIFMQNFTLKLLRAFKVAYTCCFSIGEI